MWLAVPLKQALFVYQPIELVDGALSAFSDAGLAVIAVTPLSTGCGKAARTAMVSP
jgi:hypothetical protein